MDSEFRWNPYADQPHNVIPKNERFKHHIKYAESYLKLFPSNLRSAVPGLSLYRKYKRGLYCSPVEVKDPFAISVFPDEKKLEDIVSCFHDLGINQTLVRIPSWEREKLEDYKKFISSLLENGITPVVALLQNRNDVRSPSEWLRFVEDVFSCLKDHCEYFELGHAWNRTKWGLWEYREYLELARPVVPLAYKYRVKLVGPAVIDFEFHLYPPVLAEINFAKVSSILYVDRVGAPENTQFGWDTPRKIALLKAIIDTCYQGGRDLWITEVNWPLKGTGVYSPASGRPNVTEEQQANYLVRYFIYALCSGHVERIYWWQLVAPGYGLIDNRENEWRKRPSYRAMKTMGSFLKGSTFIQKAEHPEANMFIFKKGSESFAACWTKKHSVDYSFPCRVIKAFDRNGKTIEITANKIRINESPQYAFFEERVNK